MDLGNTLKKYRENNNYSQEELAKKLFVTRQAISRWENNKTIPGVQILMQLSDLYNISVDNFLKEGNYEVANQIDKEVRQSKLLKKIILFCIGICFIFLGILSYGRKNQIEVIDRFNPFLKKEISYAIVPQKTPTKIVEVVVNGKKEKEKRFLPITTWVTNNSFGEGEWITFDIGMIPEKSQNYVVLQHKGSYVKSVRLITRKEIPTLVKINIPDEYYKFNKNAEPTGGHYNPFI
ncbi:helix-turn-helix domain-containing protein [Companilactobacillus sp. DQM5]|uniref:helix-turn-helix domain-containing protein n=1 Tax=Companilactobacillus sp. DQM5 TaxID=3463359 RepID=UPI004059921F